jgi:hypothetical protein
MGGKATEVLVAKEVVGGGTRGRDMEEVDWGSASVFGWPVIRPGSTPSVEIASYNRTSDRQSETWAGSLVPNSDLEVCHSPIPDSPPNAS